MLSLFHPDYAYRPLSGWHRLKQSVAHRARLGIPEGHRRLYGAMVQEEAAEILRPMIADICRLEGRATAERIASQFTPITVSEATEAVLRYRTTQSQSYLLRRETRKALTRQKNREQVSVVWVRVNKEKLQRETALLTALEDAMLLFDEGLSVDQISKALHLPRTKIQAQIRATKRG